MTKKNECGIFSDKLDIEYSTSVEKEFIINPDELFKNVIPKYRDSANELKKTFQTE